jgi:hypothetical protein
MWADYILCTIGDIKSYRLSPEILLGVTKDSTGLNGFLQTKIQVATDRIYDALLLEVQSRVPMLASRWMNRKRGQVDYFAQEMRREFEILSKTANIPIVPGVYDGSVIDLYMLLSMTQGLTPRTFSMPSAPVNGVQGSYAGQAYTGAVFIDTASDKMYYNTGTLLCPIWTRPNAQFVLDNILNANAGRINRYVITANGTGYLLGDKGTITGGNSVAEYVVTAVSGSTVTDIRISNSGVGYSAGVAATTAKTGVGTGLTINLTGFYQSVLRRAAIEYSLWAMAEDGLDRNRNFDYEFQMYSNKRMQDLQKNAQNTLMQCLPLIDLDIDGDGVISDFEAGFMHSPQGVFA